jgi:hypothetical protein
MNLVYALVCFLLALILVLVGATRVGAWLIERRNQPAGQFATVNGSRRPRRNAVLRPSGPWLVVARRDQ